MTTAGEGFNSRMILRPDADETVYVSAGAYADAVGTYTLTISAVEAPPDDYPESVDTTGVAEVGGRGPRATSKIPAISTGSPSPWKPDRAIAIDIEGSPHRPRVPARPVSVPVRQLRAAIADQRRRRRQLQFPDHLLARGERNLLHRRRRLCRLHRHLFGPGRDLRRAARRFCRRHRHHRSPDHRRAHERQYRDGRRRRLVSPSGSMPEKPMSSPRKASRRAWARCPTH